MSFSSVNIGQLSSPGNSLPVSPRNMPMLCPRNVEHLASPSNRQLPTSNMTMPLLSPHIKQLLSPDAIQSVSAGTNVVSSFSSRQLFPDKSEQLFTTNRQMPFNNSGQILSPNSIKQAARFGDCQEYSQEQLAHLSEVTRARQLPNVDQACQGLQVAPRNQNLIQGTRPPPSHGSPQNVWGPAMNVAPDHGHITTTCINGIYSQSEALTAPIPPREATHGHQSQFVHGTDFSLYSNPNILQNQMLNTSESSRFQVMSSEFQNNGAMLEQNREKNSGQNNNNGFPVYDLTTSQQGLPNMGPATEVKSVKCTSSSRSPGTVSESEDVIVTKVTGIRNGHETKHDQTSTIKCPKHQEDQVPGKLQGKVSSNTTHSGPLGQQVQSKSLGQGVMSGSLLCQQKSGLQKEHKDNLDGPQLPSAELLQTMMANNSPSKFVVMKMCGSDKYVILSPEKSSSFEMVYKPMGSMKLPPGKYRLHTMNASALSASPDKEQTTKQKPDGTSPSKVAQKAKKKSSIKISSTKENKECKKEKKAKQQPTKEAGTKKNKVEKKKNPLDKKPTAKDKKPTTQGKKSTEQGKKSKSKPKKANDPIDPNSKEKKKKTKSQPVEKKTEKKKEETKCRILTPCQKFCRTVLISHNKAGRIVHTISNPAIFFTGGHFLASQDTIEVEHPVFLLISDNDKILAIMSEAFSPGQYLLSSKRRVIFKGDRISSDLHDKDERKQPLQLNLFRAVLSPYNFSVSSPMKGHEIILLSQYQDVPYTTNTSPKEGSRLLEDPDLGASSSLISDVVDTWNQSYDVTTLAPCTHPLYETMKEMLKNKIDNQPKTCKYKLRVQLFDSRRKKRPKIVDEL
ncbi:uncharacterized protein LOC110444923 [Mizuhopecten yessoensis]|uniref:uncharacterized protein LOC110444923 n=1 Tax=Mizuhopecten yessoensis TaxID=6573 RepID=UPI000B45D6F5|nr:uncharacterized protein LOC110444923 [Mizuhopecten yessoensis]